MSHRNGLFCIRTESSLSFYKLLFVKQFNNKNYVIDQIKNLYLLYNNLSDFNDYHYKTLPKNIEFVRNKEKKSRND